MSQQLWRDGLWVTATDLFTSLIPALLLLLSAGAGAVAVAAQDPRIPLEELERRAAALPEFDLEALRRQVKEAADERARLAALASGGEAAPEDEGSAGLDQFKITEGLKPKYLTLTHGRIVPIREPFYKFERSFSTGFGGGISLRTKVVRVQDGQLLAEALADDGVVRELIDELDRDGEYVQLFVCSDSIATFRELVKSLRASSVPFSWDTFDDMPLYASGGAPGAAAVSGRGGSR